MDTPYEGFHLLLEASKIMDSRIDEKQKIWINLRSFGNLTIPSQVLVDNVVKWGKWFDHFHGETINKHENPIEKLCSLINSRNDLRNKIDCKLICKNSFF